MPIYGGLLAQTLVGVVDTAFLGQLGLEQQSAAGYAALFYLVFFVIGLGFTLGTQILIARRMGEGRPESVGPIFWNGVFCMLIYATLSCIFFNTCLPAFFDRITHSPEISRLTSLYLQQRSFGLYGTMLNLCFMAFYVGKGRSLAISLSAIGSSMINIVLGYAMIFGRFGMERMEIQGAALAGAIADLSGTLIFIVFTIFQKDLRKLRLQRPFCISGSRLKEITHVSLPLIVQNMISIVSWFLFFTIVEKTGEKNFGISIIARNVYSIFMMAPVALGSAANSMVSNLIGQQRQNEVLALIHKIARFSLVFMLITLVSLAGFPRTVFLLFTQDYALATQALPTLYVIVGALVIFSVSNIVFQSVSGTGQTRVALLIEISSIALYLLYTLTASYIFRERVYLVWLAEMIYMLFFGVASYLYMRSGRWQGTRI